MESHISSTNDTDRLVRWIACEFRQIPHTQLYYELFELAQITETNAEFGLQAYQTRRLADDRPGHGGQLRQRLPTRT